MPLPSQGNLLVWLRADSGTYQDRGAHTTAATADGDPVGTWADLTANGRDCSPDVDGNRPILKLSIINGKPVLRFDGLGDYLAFANNTFNSVTAAHGFLIVKKTVNADGAGYHALKGAGDSNHHRWTDSHIYDGFFSTVRKDAGTGGPDLSSAFRVYEAISISGEFTIRIDSSQIYTTATNTVGISGSNLFLGKGGGAVPLSGDIAEFFLYDGKLSAANLNLVYGYLNDQYNLGLPFTPVIAGPLIDGRLAGYDILISGRLTQ